MNKLVLALLSVAAIAGAAWASEAPTVSEVTAVQQTDGLKKVDIYYKLSDPDSATVGVRVKVSNDGGNTYNIIPVTFVSPSDVGESVPVTPTPTQKHIVWNAGEFGPVVEIAADAVGFEPEELDRLPAHGAVEISAVVFALDKQPERKPGFEAEERSPDSARAYPAGHGEIAHERNNPADGKAFSNSPEYGNLVARLGGHVSHAERDGGCDERFGQEVPLRAELVLVRLPRHLAVQEVYLELHYAGSEPIIFAVIVVRTDRRLGPKLAR